MLIISGDLTLAVCIATKSTRRSTWLLCSQTTWLPPTSSNETKKKGEFHFHLTGVYTPIHPKYSIHSKYLEPRFPSVPRAPLSTHTCIYHVSFNGRFPAPLCCSSHSHTPTQTNPPPPPPSPPPFPSGGLSYHL